MRRARNVQKRWGCLSAVLTLALVLALGLLADGFAIVSHAESQGKVTANSAYIRKEPNVTSQAVGGAEKDDVITIRGQVQGGDGYTWYQTFVDSETLGYIRSDLVEITDGTTPETVTTGETTATNPTTNTNTNETPAEVAAVNPVSATVSGGSSVRVRSNASTTSQIVKTVSNGLALTVTGTANGSDGKVWYQVSFSADNSEISGFIRSDFVTLSGELTPYTEEEPVPEEPVTDPEDSGTASEPETVKAYDTQLMDGEWYLIDNVNNEYQGIQELFDKVTNNAAAYEEANKKVKMEKAIIIILVLLLVAAAAVIALLIFKIKDMMDDAYFSEVEKETLKRREPARAQSGSSKVMHTVGAEKPAGARPAGAKPAGAVQGQRPAGARPAGAAQGQRTAGARPAGSPQGQRPAGARPAGAVQGQKPAGARPAGATQSGQPGQRPVGAAQSGQPGQRPAGARPAGTVQERPQSQKPAGNQQSWQSKNFMADDDDEFEFEFLKYDGDDEQ